MILICYGTRPEWLKIKPLICEFNKCGIKYKTLFTGQHVDIVTSRADFTCSVNNDSCKNRLNAVMVSTLSIPDNIFEDVTHVLVQGDTTSALGLALNAFNRGIKIIHLEAGLRTYDQKNPYPEEANRQIISRITDLHFCPTKDNKANLVNELCTGKIYVVGNTSLDNIKNIKTDYKDTVLVTLHRRENHNIIKDWFMEISKLALKYKKIKFILPIHPNPNVMKHKHLLEGVEVVPPLPHCDLLDILANCKTAITDSGGIQEEASFFNKKIIVCRKVTERVESINTHSFICPTPSKLNSIFRRIINNYKTKKSCPYGDGRTSQRISSILKKCIN
jgi:UDP-N-acetylglucosamine 2-epimerase (non-hydrolysing)